MLSVCANRRDITLSFSWPSIEYYKRKMDLCTTVYGLLTCNGRIRYEYGLFIDVFVEIMAFTTRNYSYYF